MSAFETIGRAPTARLDALDVRDYGAAFDNTTDDTDAIQAALDAAVMTGYAGLSGNNLPAKMVVMPAGRAKISAALQIHANTALVGVGSGSTYLVNTGSGNTIELATGTEVQVYLADFGIIVNDNSAVGIDLTYTGGASILGDTAHQVQNVVVVGGKKAFNAVSSNELRLLNFFAYRQLPVSADACVYLNATDCMIQNVTVAQPQYVTSGGSGIRLSTSNTRMVNCKVFGGSANGTSELQAPAIRIIGQRNQIHACEVQDYPGAGIEDDQGINTWSGLVIDSCADIGAVFDCGSGPLVATNLHFVNRGGAFTMPTAMSLANGKGSVVDCLVTSVASNFAGGQDGTGNYVRVNGVVEP